MNKKEARKFYKTIRSKISEKDKMTQSEAICEKLLRIVYSKEYTGILLYAPLKDEVDVFSIFEKALNITDIYFPRVAGDDMEFYKVSSEEDLSIQSFNVREPKEYCQTIEYKEKGRYLCVVPGISFDQNGGRIGYGKGYYDKYLSLHANENIETVGVCFKECLSDGIEINEFDVCVKCVLTI